MKTIEQIQDTSGRNIQKYNRPMPSPYKCDCGGQLYYDTSHIIVFGAFTRSASCNNCDKKINITNKNERF